ncbi:Gfo/Idh/MocA family protein [Azospirillum sp. B506]|uniref:Gfo/Idh/MocA family protein n=1 Tax=Azospirillum sp. B506 TaxID=137721 RepID=UPI00034783AA|nr:Gfo/Idh/MocA family oxidoreductase [Azospirillum sp. B506]
MTAGNTKMDARLAVIGAGAIGRLHIDVLLKGDATSIGRLVAIADPAEAARVFAAERGIPWFADHLAMLDEVCPDGAVIATPNAAHAPVALACMARGVAVLVEKPIAETVEAARAIAEASRRTGVPVLVGHHRRHNPVIRAAKAAIADGLIGMPTIATVAATFLKPDSYFTVDWRRQTGEGGPILINLIHEIDLLRFLLGEIDGLQAMRSNAVRGFAVEDTAAVLLRLRNGALATLSLSDATASPRNWDLASGEIPSLARHPVETHFLSGTGGSLALPSLEYWSYAGERGWHVPMTRGRLSGEAANPYVNQLRHFVRVIRGEEEPIVGADDATRTLTATLAVHQAADGGPVVFAEDGFSVRRL